jgi:hypothetical protein
MFPDFLGIGAQKAGTTWLSRNLQLHPQIWIPPVKEIHYFDELFHEPANGVLRLSKRLLSRRTVYRRWRKQVRDSMRLHLVEDLSVQNLARDLQCHMRPYNDAWYASMFEPSNEKKTGEITPAYSVLDRDTISHVHRLMPEAKIIFMMRNPIERPWSQTVMRLDNVSKYRIGLTKERKIHRSLTRQSSRARTEYLRTLKNWETFYPEEQIFVGFLEDVGFFPKELLRSLHGFLGVDPSFIPPGVERKVDSRSKGEMPTRFAVYLAQSYYEQLKELDKCFGGYASFWLYCAERLIEDPPKEGFIPYPLGESYLWEEWAESRKVAMQSGPLSSSRTIA